MATETHTNIHGVRPWRVRELIQLGGWEVKQHKDSAGKYYLSATLLESGLVLFSESYKEQMEEIEVES